MKHLAIAAVACLFGAPAPQLGLLAAQVQGQPIGNGADVDTLLQRAAERSAGGDDGEAERLLRQGLERHGAEPRLWLALIDGLNARGRHAVALREIARAERKAGPSPELHLRAAQAYYGLEQYLGRTQVRRVTGGRVGSFAAGSLLIEERGEPDRFLCSPPESALHQVRRALDAGLDEPAAHVLHARIWSRAGRPKAAFALLAGREAALLPAGSEPDADVLEAYAELALAADELMHYLRYRNRLAEGHPDRSAAIRCDACLVVAQRYNERGDGDLYIRFLQRALKARPHDTALRLQLADAEWAAGQRAAATAHYRQVLAAGAPAEARQRIVQRLAEPQRDGAQPR